MGNGQPGHKPAGAEAMPACFASPGAQIHHGGLAPVVIVAAAMCGPAFESAIAQIPVSDERRWRQVATGWDAGGGVLLRSAHAPEAPLRAGGRTSRDEPLLRFSFCRAGAYRPASSA
jgi:cation diffusion facilitator CzcD-associated flavoprotein CzcO